jgi:signal transduction histidine kinase
LSVQHLQRSLDQGQEINTAQINRLASNLVEQIDALSEIASAFSNFARMPMAKPKVIDLVAILSSTVALYESFDRSTFTLNIGVSGSAQVVSDKEQLLRVFNNLIKNALQAIGDKKRGQIDITLLSDAEGYRVSLKDNGSGIQEEDYNRIFVPNFTTKSRGMGLGLAMTKNIVENSNGKIWFESVAGSGSTFHVWLPRA